MNLKSKERNWIAATIIGAITIALVNWIWPGVIPIETFSLWDHHNGGVTDWLVVGVPVFVWGFAIQTISEFVKSASSKGFFESLLRIDDPSPTQVFFGGLVVSAWAGFAEEVGFRWLIFLSTIVWVKVSNFIFLGFAGLNIIAWLHNHVFGWLADKVTFGYLHDIIFHSSGWAVGAAMLSSNAFFRDGHKYQGIKGILNSWFLGMFFFWVMFHHGLWAAITVHFVYDVIVFTVAALGLAARK